MDGADVGMVQCGRGPRLALEPLDSLRIGREGSREELQGDVPAEVEILGLVHHAHATAAEAACHLIMSHGLPEKILHPGSIIYPMNITPHTSSRK